MLDTKTSAITQLHLRSTPHSHNKWSLYFLVTGLIAIHQQLKKNRFIFIFSVAGSAFH